MSIRQNFAEEAEGGVNKQINLELNAFYIYLSMSYHFDRHDVGLKGFHEFFKKRAHEELKHAEKFMEYQNKRGGTIVLAQIQKPNRDSWSYCLEAMEAALNLEKTSISLSSIYTVASKAGDEHMTDFIESNYLAEQVEDIKQLGEHVTNLKRVGLGIGEYLFDKKTLKH